MILKFLYLRRRCKISLWKSLTLRFDIVLLSCKTLFQNIVNTSYIDLIQMFWRLMYDTKYWNFAWHVWHTLYYTSLLHESYRKQIHTWFTCKSRDWSSTSCVVVKKQRVGCALTQGCNNDDVFIKFPVCLKIEHHVGSSKKCKLGLLNRKERIRSKLSSFF